MNLSMSQPGASTTRTASAQKGIGRSTDRLKAPRTVAAVYIRVDPDHAQRRLVLAQQLGHALHHFRVL
jgi:hypothetical protein